MTRVKGFMKFAAFAVAVLLFIRGAVRIMVPKNYTGEWLSPVTSYCGFYKLERDTVDVLFLGSSHTYASFCPQVLYDEYGITSYNMGMGNQNLLLSYYWLKEALRTQSPSVVVLEGTFAFNRFDNPSNSEEAVSQKSLNYMHWTRNRIEAIQALCEIEPDMYSWESFIPGIRYHDRWKELHEEDFTLSEIASRNQLMGYTGAFRYYCRIKDYKPYSATDLFPEDRGEKIVPAMEEYLDRTVDLCRENKIRLILALTPSTETTHSMHVGLLRYAKKQGVEFIDFNTTDMIREMDYKFEIHNADEEHPSVWGAQIITRELGKYLSGKKGSFGPPLLPHWNEQWENTGSYYEKIVRDAELMHTKDIEKYLSALKDDRYSVFISVNGDVSSGVNDEIAGELHDLGLREDIRNLGGDAYFAVIDAGKVLQEERGPGELYSTGSIRKGRTIYEIESEGSGPELQNDGFSSIVINDYEQSVNRRGINIAVVNNENAAVIDKVCFQTGETLEAAR